MSAAAPETFSITDFESLVHRECFEDATRELVRLLVRLDTSEATSASESYVRLAFALARLFTNPRFQLSESGYEAIQPFHRHVASLFGSAGFTSTDHLVRPLSRPPVRKLGDPLVLPSENIRKFAVLYGPSSALDISPDEFWARSPALAADAYLAMLSHSNFTEERAYQTREALLRWLPPRLENLTLQPYQLHYFTRAWMHCSYASTPDKHHVKRVLNSALRRTLALDAGHTREPESPRRERARPVAVVVLESFFSRHAMYRCYARSIQALREHFELVAIARADQIDDVARGLFDRTIVFENTILRDIAEQVRVLAPDVLYLPSVGMWSGAISIANMRLAPLQIATLGHPATTHSDNVDHVLVERGFAPSPACFSEHLVRLPDGSMPFVANPDAPRLEPEIRESPEVIRIAVPANAVKLNPPFLETCVRIARRADRCVEFHFFPGCKGGPLHLHVEHGIRHYIPDAVVHRVTEYGPYLEAVGWCDIQLNTFPFGNTNGNIDAALLGLPMVSLDGPEVHSHVDVEMSRRLGLPGYVCADTVTSYEAACLRLLSDDAERVSISRHLLDHGVEDVFFSGDASAFGDAVRRLHEDRDSFLRDSE